MATHKISYKLLASFDDGSQHYIEIPEKVYYYNQQKYNYWINWIESLIKEKEITAKPIRIEEVHAIIEVEEYSFTIGL